MHASPCRVAHAAYSSSARLVATSVEFSSFLTEVQEIGAGRTRSTRAPQEERELHHRRATLNKAILPRACTPRLKTSLSSSFLEQASRILFLQTKRRVALTKKTMKEKCEVRSAKRALSRRSAPHRPRRHDRDRADIHVGAGDRECYRWDAPFPEKFPAKEQQRGLVAFAKDWVAFGVGCDSRIALFAEQ